MSATPAPKIIQRMNAFNKYMSEDCLGGPRLIKMASVINFQKGMTVLWVAALMWHFQNFSAAAWTYLALHGSYGIIWLMKDRLFPDPNWEKRTTFAGAFNMWAMVLGPYWVAPFLLISNVLGPRPETPTWLLGTAGFTYAIGLVLMTGADAQKYFTLKVKRGLITDGFFKRIRHPNYLGEMMIYGSFAMIVQHWLPWAILAWVWINLFTVNMLMKEASMSRYPEWAAYKARSGMLLPKLLVPASAPSPTGQPTTKAA